MLYSNKYFEAWTYFENVTEVTFWRSRRNIPEFYTKRYRGNVFKKWLGYEVGENTGNVLTYSQRM